MYLHREDAKLQFKIDIVQYIRNVGLTQTLLLFVYEFLQIYYRGGVLDLFISML